MNYFTVGIHYNKDKIAYVKCTDNERAKLIDIQDKCFLLIIVTEGAATFQCGDEEFTVAAPAFVCFNERQNPTVRRHRGFKGYNIYFHPQFLNINMTFSLLREEGYDDVAHRHDLFLLKPFLDGTFVVPINENYVDKLVECFLHMKVELEHQYDWYWSCRSRTYFMEIIIVLERMYGIRNNAKVDSVLHSINDIYNDKLKYALLYIESHYSAPITLSDIVQASSSNHTTLTQLFKKELSVTPMEYLWQYRICVAKKHLAFSELSPKEIAVRCGFKTVQHFSRIFKEQTGKTPLCYRREALFSRRREIALKRNDKSDRILSG